MSRTLISIYKSPKREEMYLYVDKRQGLKEVPEALLTQFGKPQHVADMLLTAERKLARANAQEILDNVAAKGFYLQMPPPLENYMKELQDRIGKTRKAEG